MSSTRVFIAHAQDDELLAGSLKQCLTNHLKISSEEVFVSSDGSISPSQDFPTAIKKSLREAAAVLAVLTPHSVNRLWVHFEAGGAFFWPDSHNRKDLIVLRARGLDASALPDTLRFQTARDLRLEKTVTELLRHLHDLLRLPGQFDIDDSGVKKLVKAARCPSSAIAPAAVPSLQSIVYPNRGDAAMLQILNQRLAGASKIDTVGIANNRLTCDVSVDFYRDFLTARKGNLRLLFLDPAGKQIRAREKAENRERGALSFVVRHNLEDVQRFLHECANENPSVASNVAVRLYDFAPHLNLIVVDDVAAFVHYYGTHSRGYDAPSFVITEAEPRVLAWYRQEFESLWALGSPVRTINETSRKSPALRRGPRR